METRFVDGELVKDVTIREVYEAIAKNGFEHLRKEWLCTNNDGVVIGGCVLQQAALNLGVQGPSRYLSIVSSADKYSLVEQLNQYTLRKNSKWAKFAALYGTQARGLGNVIIHWNDD